MGSPLRVLHVVVNMNRGGAEMLLMNLYRNIDKSMIQFDFLTCKEGVFDQEIIELGGIVHRVPYITDVGHRGYVNELNHFFHTHKEYKIIHSHMDKMSGLVLKAAKDNNIPTRIAHSHNTSSEGNTLAKFYKWYVGKNIASSATHLFACSNQAAHWLFREKKKEAKILRNGIETSSFKFSALIRKQIREEFLIDESSFVIGHIGRFNHQKNHSYLLKIFAKVARKHTNAYLLLVGDGVLRKEIEKKIKKLKLEERVILTGVREDIPHLLQAIDLFVFPSLHEGLPVTLIEAQAACTPCMISDVISREVDMGLNLINYISLKDQGRWIDEIDKQINTRASREVDSVSALGKKGYDIKSTASWTEGFYSAI